MTSVTVPGFEGALGTRNTTDIFLRFPRLQRRRVDGHLIVGFPGKKRSGLKIRKLRTVIGRATRCSTRRTTNPHLRRPHGRRKTGARLHHGGRLRIRDPDPSDPTKPRGPGTDLASQGLRNFTHGMGLGDINGDGRTDLIEKDGWWEQPASPGWRSGSGPSTRLLRTRRLPDARLRREWRRSRTA